MKLSVMIPYRPLITSSLFLLLLAGCAPNMSQQQAYYPAPPPLTHNRIELANGQARYSGVIESQGYRDTQYNQVSYVNGNGSIQTWREYPDSYYYPHRPPHHGIRPPNYHRPGWHDNRPGWNHNRPPVTCYGRHCRPIAVTPPIYTSTAVGISGRPVNVLPLSDKTIHMSSSVEHYRPTHPVVPRYQQRR